MGIIQDSQDRVEVPGRRKKSATHGAKDGGLKHARWEGGKPKPAFKKEITTSQRGSAKKFSLTTSINRWGTIYLNGIRATRCPVMLFFHR
jgi:hypothetical protein